MKNTIKKNLGQLKKCHFNNNAFTLTELLVSTAIVGILVSIAIPMFNDYKKKSYDSIINKVIHEAVTASQAIQIEMQDIKRPFPWEYSYSKTPDDTLERGYSYFDPSPVSLSNYIDLSGDKNNHIVLSLSVGVTGTHAAIADPSDYDISTTALSCKGSKLFGYYSRETTATNNFGKHKITNFKTGDFYRKSRGCSE